MRLLSNSKPCCTAMRSPLSDSAAAPLPKGAVLREVERWRGALRTHVQDVVAEEIPVAFIYNERPHAVMMATPDNLDDFALGFSLSEAIINHPGEFYSVEAVPAMAGIELRIAIAAERAVHLDQRVRELTGRTGCGLCGAQTLDAAVRHPPPVSCSATIDALALRRALSELGKRQTINASTGATHAAAWSTLQGSIVDLREDVGRHNALDKLIGALALAKVDPRSGFLVITSRASYEMVMKAATVGIGIVAAISAPTALAIAMANSSSVTLIGFARADSHVVYSRPERLLDSPRSVAP
jgi:FdhD protein